MKLEDVADKFLTVNSEEELLGLFGRVLKSNGFNNYAISTVTPEGPAMIGAEMPEGWGEYYMDRGYWQIDPVFKSMTESWMPHVWEDLIDEDTPADIMNFMDEASDSGLRHGHTVSIKHLGQKMNLAISSTDQLDADYERRMIARTFALSSMFAARRATIKSDTTPLKFSPRELECTKWIVAGKSNAEIAESMNISIKTVEEFIRRICVKNHLSGRMEISIQAILHGLVDIS